MSVFLGIGLLTNSPSAVAAGGKGGCAAPTASHGNASVVCLYTGKAETWRVPAGVTSVTFNLYGAQGGSQGDTAHRAAGGLGAHLRDTLKVKPGTVLVIVVGGTPLPGSISGGFNGGGSATGRVRAQSTAGGGGGGATDVRTGPSLADRVLVAGGGGGNGGNGYSLYWSTNFVWAQGAAGATSAAEACCGVNGGGGGTYNMPGAGGKGGADYNYGPPQTYAPSGSPGALGVGGSGPGGSQGLAGGGGGGGGGYYGGGGGGAASRCRTTPEQCAGFATGGYGGGGGSDFPQFDGSRLSVTDGVRWGNGLAILTYREP
jgi:hypothetical protein